jgi:hypothetical protein
MKLPRGLNAPATVTAVAQVSLISAPLGVALDNQHGLFNVLSYNAWSYTITSPFDAALLVKSAYWVPALFAVAGFAMSLIQLTADIYIKGGVRQSSGPKTLYNISLFAFQYYLSGALDFLRYDALTINLILSALAIAGFLFFDGTVPGLVLALATAVAGPAAELALINGPPHAYFYTHADFFGICSWIPSVYFLGGSAVGNLARSLYHHGLLAKDE